MYLPWENVSQDHSRAQVTSAWANGCETAAYYWQYRTSDPIASAHEACALARDCGISVPIVFDDIETYTDGSIPSADAVRAGGEQCAAEGFDRAIYSSEAMWKKIGNPVFGPEWKAWVANYGVPPNVNVPGFGGMTVVGHQWVGGIQDQSLFDGAKLVS